MGRESRREDPRRFPSGGPAYIYPYPTTGMMAWYEASRGVTGGTSPTLWANQAPVPPTNSNLVNVNSVVWAASDAEFNNLPAMDFTAADNLCFNSAGVWGTAVPLGATYIFVGRVRSSGIVTFHGLVDGPAGNRNGVLYDPGSAPVNVQFAGSAAVTSTGSLVSVAVVWAVFNGASSSWGINSKTATGSGNPGTQTNTRLIVGGHSLTPGSGTNGCRGKMAEVLVYSTLSVSDRNSILDTLGAKYNKVIAP